MVDDSYGLINRNLKQSWSYGGINEDERKEKEAVLLN